MKLPKQLNQNFFDRFLMKEGFSEVEADDTNLEPEGLEDTGMKVPRM